MNKQRIIRTKSVDGRKRDAAELNFRDLETLGNKIVGDAMVRCEAIEKKKELLEEQIRQRHQSMESEYEGRRQELEKELKDAQERVSKFVEDARQKGFSQGQHEGFQEGLTTGHREGFEKGYSEGREAGYKEGRDSEIRRIQEETSRLVPTIQALTSEISAKRNELVHAARRELVRLAVKVAEKILQREIQQLDEAVLASVSKAVDMVFHRSKVTIQLHPDDIVVVEKYAQNALDVFSVFREFELVPVEDMSRGGCRVASGPGLVDLAIETQLEVIEEGLIEATKGRHVVDLVEGPGPADQTIPEGELESPKEPRTRDDAEGGAPKQERQGQPLAEEIAS